MSFENYRSQFALAKELLERETRLLREQEQRKLAAKIMLDTARIGWVRSIPAGSGLAVAKDLPWEHWQYREGRWTIDAGAHIPSALSELPDIVRITGTPISETFNGAWITCSPGMSAEYMLSLWNEYLAKR